MTPDLRETPTLVVNIFLEEKKEVWKTGKKQSVAKTYTEPLIKQKRLTFY